MAGSAYCADLVVDAIVGRDDPRAQQIEAQKRERLHDLGRGGLAYGELGTGRGSIPRVDLGADRLGSAQRAQVKRRRSGRRERGYRDACAH